MNNRELLELAAKAAGIPLIKWGEAWQTDNGDPYGPGFIAGTRPFILYWNPLSDDGDALRLAVRLQMQLRLKHSDYEVSVYGAPTGRIDESVFGDPLAATRRAIVRAAAEIGKTM